MTFSFGLVFTVVYMRHPRVKCGIYTLTGHRCRIGKQGVAGQRWGTRQMHDHHTEDTQSLLRKEFLDVLQVLLIRDVSALTRK
jgi:hypothetical protein